MRQYEVFEKSWQAGKPDDNWVQTELTAVFEKGQKRTAVKGFYAGNGVYTVRFLPLEAGDYICTVTGQLPAMKGSSIKIQEQFELIAEPAAEGVHGPVRANGTHFVHDDGRLYLPFGTTVYALHHQKEELLEETFQTLAQSPFNKIRFCVFPKYYEFNHNEPKLFAFEREGENWNTKKPCMEYWRLLDIVTDRLNRLGIQADLILFHPYDKWGFAMLTKAQRLDYLDYLCRRLGAYPNLWWSLANEYDQLDELTTTDWKEMSAFLAENDPNRHLISNHNFMTPWDFSDSNTTHICLQESNAAKIPGLLRKFGKPVIYDEMGYEGNIPYSWGNLSAFEMVNRFWKTVTMGGYATHGETYMKKMDHDQVLWWSKGGRLKGESVSRIAFLKKLLSEMPGHMEYLEHEGTKLESQTQLQELIDAKTPGISDNPVLRCMAKMDDMEFTYMQQFFQQPMIHCGTDVYLTYLGDACTIYSILELPDDRSYRIEVIDVWEMTRTTVQKGVNGRVEVELPGKQGMAVLAVAE